MTLNLLVMIVFILGNLMNVPTHVLADVELVNGAYQDIVVAIHPTLAENPAYINRIKTIFTTASDFLYTATERKAYFGNITVLIPSTWSKNNNYTTAGGQSFANSHVRIDLPSARYGNDPYVKQTRDCGMPGDYMHLTPDYVLDPRGTAVFNYGDYGRLIVREWARLRYGVFEESGDELNIQEFPMFYYDEMGVVRPVVCEAGFTGVSRDRRTHGRCERDPSSGLPDTNCRFYPEILGSESPVSLMSMHHVPSVHTFCRDEHNSNGQQMMLHNKVAPSKQNKHCNYQSTWSVIMKHRDFEGSFGPVSVPSTLPTFNIVQYSGTRYILVMDVSNSMNIGQRLRRLQQAGTTFINSYLELHSELGMCIFSTTASTTLPMTELEREEQRAELVAKLPPNANGGTNIGSGIICGLDNLESEGGSAKGAILILMSDGEHNTPNSNDYTLPLEPRIKSSGVIIYTLAITAGADTKMEKLATWTGGKSYVYSPDNDVTSLDDIFKEATESTSEDITKQAVEIQKYQTELPSIHGSGGKLASQLRDFIIDCSLEGGRTEFSFAYIQAQGISVHLTDPEGNTTMHTSSTVADSNRILLITKTGTKRGLWKYEMENLYTFGPQRVSVAIRSWSKQLQPAGPDMQDSGRATLRMDGWMDKVSVVFPNYPSIFAELTAQFSPILGADVYATVSRFDITHSVIIPLLDNGAGADIEAKDGVYSAYFTQFSGNDRYSVTIKASSVRNRTSIQTSQQQADKICLLAKDIMQQHAQGQRRSKATAISQVVSRSSGINYNTSQELMTFRMMDSFERYVSPGSFQVTAYSSSLQDILPPSRITDLRLLSISAQLYQIILEWTAPGSNLDHGTVDHYEVVVGDNFTNLLSNKSSGQPLNETLLEYNETLFSAPVSAGNTQFLKMMAPAVKTSYVFAVRGVDTSANKGDWSNLVIATFIRTDVEQPPVTEEQTDNIALALGITAGVVTVLVVIIVILWRRKIRNSHTV